MDTDFLIAAVSMLVILAGAAERLVEVIKGFIPGLNGVLEDPIEEARRKAYVQALTIAVCVGTALLTRGQIMEALRGAGAAMDLKLVLAMGVMSAGGSSLWNSVLTYLVSAKDIKKAEATDRKTTVEHRRNLTLDLVPPSGLAAVGSTTR